MRTVSATSRGRGTWEAAGESRPSSPTTTGLPPRPMGRDTSITWPRCTAGRRSGQERPRPGHGRPGRVRREADIRGKNTDLAVPGQGRTSLTSFASRSAVGAHDTDRAGDAGAVVRAVPVGVFTARKILLVVVLGEVELARGHDLRRDLPVPRLGELLLVGVP